MELENVSLNELEQRMESSDMKIFCAAAKILISKNSKEAYNILKKYAFSSDKYKRRYVLSVIFEYPDAIEIANELNKVLSVENANSFMTTTILEILIKFNIKIDDNIVSQALANSNINYGWYYQVIGKFDKNEKNLEQLLALYHTKGKCTSIRIYMAEQLLEFANEENYMRLFQLFEKDEQPHIRMVACRIANKMNRQDLLISFKNDKDGHIRKYVISATKHTP